MRLLESRLYNARKPYVDEYATARDKHNALVSEVITAFKKEAEKHKQTFPLTVDEYGTIEVTSSVGLFLADAYCDHECSVPNMFMCLPAVKQSYEKLKAERDRDNPQLNNLSELLTTIRRHLTCYEADSPTIRREIKQFNEEIKKLETDFNEEIKKLETATY